LQPRKALTGPALAELAQLDDTAFRKLFSASPVKRIGRDRFLRNVLIAIGNSGDPALIESARANLGDPSPLVRAMAVWALQRLDPVVAVSLRDGHLARESDTGVRTEWTAL
jgi:epoxyqueuosine reductase